MAQAAREKEIIIYGDAAGKEPFVEWLTGLKDKKITHRIQTRLFRLEQGNYGDCKSLKDGIFELRFSFGSGYRVYFGEEGDKIIVLLIGGDKSTQKKDIEQAKVYWKEYQSHD